MKTGSTRYYLDESGTFEGNEHALVCGLQVMPGGPGDHALRQLLGEGIKALSRVGVTLVNNKIHATELKKLSREGYIAFMQVILAGLERWRKTLRIFSVWDRAGVKFKDRNVAHAAVVSRGLAEHLASTQVSGPVHVTIAGRSTDRSQISNTNATLDHVVLSRLAEELALAGKELLTPVKIEVVHIGDKTWRDRGFGGLLLADLVSNLLFTGRRGFTKLFNRAQALLADGCPIRLNRANEQLRGERILKTLGPASYLVWFHGPAGPVEPDDQERKRSAEALAMVNDRQSALPVLQAMVQAMDRQLLEVRNLAAAGRLAQELIRLTDTVADQVGTEEALSFTYRGLNAMLDVANHRGSVPGAKKVEVREKAARQRHGLGCLVHSLEFRNRFAETWINAYNFDQAASDLDQLLDDVDEVSKLLDLGRAIPTRGRILSHRAQVHHYLGNDQQALRLYRQVPSHYDRPLDLEILAHHRARSLLGLGKLAAARRLLEELGVKDNLKGFPRGNVFLLDLTALFLRVALDRGRLGDYRPLADALHGKRAWIGEVKHD